ncbi:MAG: hypothetical protein WA973_03665 [Mesorhizobium sp.]
MADDMTSPVAYRRLARPSWQTGFGPYLLVESMPWLFLAMTMRTIAVTQPTPVAWLLFIGTQFVLLVAFSIASGRMIAIAGGITMLRSLSMREQWLLSWAVVWRTFVVGMIANYIARRAGMNVNEAGQLVFGFDGVAFNRHFDVMLLWSPVVASLAFLMVVEKGMGRRATLRGSLRSLLTRWRHMLAAVLIIIPCVFILNLLQRLVGPGVGRFVNGFLPDRLIVFAVICFLFVFAFARLWLTVALLTYALRRPYREAGGDEPEQ